MDKKIRILFDASALAEGWMNSVNRTGIYFCASNILSELEKRGDVEIAYYCNERSISRLIHEIQRNSDVKEHKIVNQNPILCCLSGWWVKTEQRRCECRSQKKRIRHDYFAILEIVIEKMAQLCNCTYQSIINDYDLFFSVKYQAPEYILKNKSIAKMVLLHDAIAIIHPEFFKVKFQRFRKTWLEKLVESMNNEEWFITNSRQTKNDFLQCRPDIDDNRIFVNYLACSSAFKPCIDMEQLAKVKEKYEIPSDKKYLFSLCAIEPRKNLVRIVRTFIQFVKKNQIDDMVMALGGKAWDSFVREFETQAVSGEDFEKYVVRIGYVEDEDLPILYSGAMWFVYTSQYEGFGLPPLEAMSCGCPVITSNSTSLPEVVGDAGILIDWDSDEQHIEAYERYYFDEKYRRKYAEKGLERAKDFSWKNHVDTMLKIYWDKNKNTCNKSI